MRSLRMKKGDPLVEQWESTGLLHGLDESYRSTLDHALDMVFKHMGGRIEDYGTLCFVVRAHCLVLPIVARLVRHNLHKKLSPRILDIAKDVEEKWSGYTSSFGGEEGMKEYESALNLDLEAEFCASYSENDALKFLI